MKILWIDDVKQPSFYNEVFPELATCELLVICRDFNTARVALHAWLINWDRIYIDHDLGGEKTGYDLMNTMEEDMARADERRGNCETIPSDSLVPLSKTGEIHIISNNPVGAQRMYDLGVKLLGAGRVFRSRVM